MVEFRPSGSNASTRNTNGASMISYISIDVAKTGSAKPTCSHSGPVPSVPGDQAPDQAVWSSVHSGATEVAPVA
eukprot:5714165-Prymnesium_polylepis.2